ncbi:MAG TPA: lipase family protein [Rickettsiales bacterium]|nr:lipase family protein [Rickettsiales bacterium]
MPELEAAKPNYDAAASYVQGMAATLTYLPRIIEQQPPDGQGFGDLETIIKGDPERLKEAVHKARIASNQGVINISQKLAEHDWGGWRVKSIEADGIARALVFKTPENNTLVSFRGTQPTHLKQWAKDAEFLLQEMKLPSGDRCRGHPGFLEELGMISLPLTRELEEGRFAMTGHSAGGAMAVMYGLQQPEKDKVEGIITQGQPRALDKEGAELVKAYFPDYFRVVNGNDIVPYLPPNLTVPVPLLNRIALNQTDYFHAGTEIAFRNGLRVEESPEARATIQQALISVMGRLRVLHEVGDHSPGNYLESLRRDMERGSLIIAQEHDITDPPVSGLNASAKAPRQQTKPPGLG